MPLVKNTTTTTVHAKVVHLGGIKHQIQRSKLFAINALLVKSILLLQQIVQHVQTASIKHKMMVHPLNVKHVHQEVMPLKQYRLIVKNVVLVDIKNLK